MKDKDTQEVDSPSGWKVRTRSGLDSWAPAVAVLLVIVALAGGWMTYTAYAVEEEPKVEEVVTAEWSTDPGFSHTATVERSNPLYEVGQEVRSNPVYYTSITPVLNGTYGFEYTATEGGSLDVVTEVQMVLRETDGEDLVYWSQTETIVEKEVTDVEPRQRVNTEFTVDVPRVRQRMDSIKSGLGANIGEGEVVLVLTTSMEGEVNGEEVNYGEGNRVRVNIKENTYTVETGEEGISGRSFETTEQVEVEPEQDSKNMMVSPLLLIVSLGLLAGLIVAKHKGVIAPTERQLLAMERQEYDEWISTGKVSDDVLSNGKRSVVRIDSIEGLVDIAIDIGGRVIEDHGKEVLSVIGEDVVYVYEYEENIQTEDDSEAMEYDGIVETKEETNGEDGDETDALTEPTDENDGSETEEKEEREEWEEDEDLFERLEEHDL